VFSISYQQWVTATHCHIWIAITQIGQPQPELAHQNLMLVVYCDIRGTQLYLACGRKIQLKSVQQTTQQLSITAEM